MHVILILKAMNYWWILYVFDGVVFFFVALTVLYLLFFAIASLFSRHSEVPRTKQMNRFIIIIPAYKKDSVVFHTVNSVLGQTYPQRLFDIVVISDHQEEMTNMRLAQSPVTLLTPDFDDSSKAKSIQFAFLNLPQFKIYDAVLILDAGNVVEPEFLEQANDIFNTAGTQAIQIHRLAKNRDTSVSRLDAIFEEINNAIFRRGQNAMGLSASLYGSGMIFAYEWFKNHIMLVHPFCEDKELEMLLLRENIYIDYFENIHIYDEKTRTAKDFNNQRGRWASYQFHAIVSNLHFLPTALLSRSYDLVNKLVQWMLIPRMILMGIILLMSLLLPFIYFSLVIKWWVAAAVVMFAFSLATPNYLVDKNWDKDFLYAPWLIMWGFVNIVRVAMTETRLRFNSTRRALRKLRK